MKDCHKQPRLRASLSSNLRTQLREEAIANADRDLAIAAEWFPLEQEGAQLGETGRSRKASGKNP